MTNRPRIDLIALVKKGMLMLSVSVRFSMILLNGGDMQ